MTRDEERAMVERFGRIERVPQGTHGTIRCRKCKQIKSSAGLLTPLWHPDWCSDCAEQRGSRT